MEQERTSLWSSLLTEHGHEYRVAAALGLVLLLNATGIFNAVLGIDTALVVTAIAGYKTFQNTFAALIERRISADVALCIAVIAAVSVGEYLAAAEATFIVMVGETLESFAAGRTEAAIERFVAQLPRAACLLRGDSEEVVAADDLVPGDVIAVRAGERIAADGVVEAGYSSVDESSMTGEALPNDKGPGSRVFSGTINSGGYLTVRVDRAGNETALARVAALVREAKERAAPVERLADRAARFFLPGLLLAAALTFYFTGSWTRTVAVLLVACPCALILATPTAMVAAIGGLARRGILIRGGDVLQRAAKVTTVVFDKTGTVTEGRFEVCEVVPLSCGEDRLLALAAAAQRSSTHALARAVTEEVRRRGIPIPDSAQSRTIPGQGVECRIGGTTVRAGSPAFLERSGIQGTASLAEHADRMGATAILVADGDELAGGILLRDGLRAGVREAVAGLREIGVVHQSILTGDRHAPASAIAREAGIDHVEAELLPEQKLERIRTLPGPVAMIGDGINDAPALAAASVGVAVAGASDIAAEAAGAIYLPRSLERLPTLFTVSRRALRTAWMNIIVFAGLANLAAVIACATGGLGPVGAAATHQLASFCVMLNSLRLLRVDGGTRWVWRSRMPRLAWRRWIRPVFGAICGFVAMSGFYSIGPGDTGVIERFGRKIVPFRGPGLHYKMPWPFERLTRIAASRVRVVEIGFRSNAVSTAFEPPAYEWNVAHRGGRYESRPEEARSLTGDQNLIELNASVHYDVARVDAFLFGQLDAGTAVRAAAESAIHAVAASQPLDVLLTTGREAVEARAAARLQQMLDRYGTGVRVLRVKLEDVHPSSEVVTAFRDVSAAFEEKNRLVRESEGYANEQIALARGNAKAAIESARKYTAGRTQRAAGESGRFILEEQAYRTAPGPTETRLYLEAVELALPGKRKLIVGPSKERRHLMLLDDGVELTPALVSGRN